LYTETGKLAKIHCACGGQIGGGSYE